MAVRASHERSQSKRDHQRFPLQTAEASDLTHERLDRLAPPGTARGPGSVLARVQFSRYRAGPQQLGWRVAYLERRQDRRWPRSTSSAYQLDLDSSLASQSSKRWRYLLLLLLISTVGHRLVSHVRHFGGTLSLSRIWLGSWTNETPPTKLTTSSRAVAMAQATRTRQRCVSTSAAVLVAPSSSVIGV